MIIQSILKTCMVTCSETLALKSSNSKILEELVGAEIGDKPQVYSRMTHG